MGESALDRPKIDVLVLDACLRQSLVCVRSLGSRWRVAAADYRRSPASASRWCTTAVLVPDVTRDAPAFVDSVVRVVRRLRPRVLITSHDGSIEALRKHRDDLGASLALCTEAALAVANSKGRTYDVADSLGVRRPRTISVEGVADVAAALAEIPPPVVVKPDRSWIDGGRTGLRVGSRLAVDRVEAEQAARELHEHGVAVLLQEWVGGRREAVSLLYQGGRVRMRFAQVAYRMVPPLGGASVVRESIDLPRDATDAAEQLVAAIGLEGYSEVEFRRDAEGKAVLMEINARLSASLEVAVRSGVDFPRGLFLWAAGEEVPEVAGFRTGVKVRWLGGDISWLYRTLRSQGKPDSLPAARAAAVFAGDFFRPAAYDYLTPTDPAPAVVASSQFVSRVAGRAARRLREVVAA